MLTNCEQIFTNRIRNKKTERLQHLELVFVYNDEYKMKLIARDENELDDEKINSFDLRILNVTCTERRDVRSKQTETDPTIYRWDRQNNEYFPHNDWQYGLRTIKTSCSNMEIECRLEWPHERNHRSQRW
jgi:hypothetical protein